MTIWWMTFKNNDEIRKSFIVLNSNPFILDDEIKRYPRTRSNAPSLFMESLDANIHFIKDSPDQSHFIFEINVGKKRIRHRTTLNFEWSHVQSVLIRSWNSSFNFRLIVSRIRLFPTLVSKIKWSGSELPLNFLSKLTMYKVYLCT